MTTDIHELIEQCLAELDARGYSENRKLFFDSQWKLFTSWMAANSITVFNSEVARRYCEEKLGMYILKPNSQKLLRERLRAIRILVSYQSTGDFEFRSPSSDHTVTGPMAPAANSFLEYLSKELHRSSGTMAGKQWVLHLFATYLGDKPGLPASLVRQDIEAFLESARTRETHMPNTTITLRQFLRFLVDRGFVEHDLSVFIPIARRPRNNKIPTTYTADEVGNLLAAVETSSAIGKRDYLILLLASEYGLRASDIVGLEFNDIDWDRNVIVHRMQKTKEPVELPLLGSVGNAIIDYLDGARPECDNRHLIVRHCSDSAGQSLSSSTLHSVVTRYMKEAGIKDWQNKRHGPHALRHSFATRMMGQGVSIPVISQALGIKARKPPTST